MKNESNVKIDYIVDDKNGTQIQIEQSVKTSQASVLAEYVKRCRGEKKSEE